MPFPYKTILLTGASSGLGLVLTKRLLESGCTVIAVSRTATSNSDLQALAAENASTLHLEDFDCLSITSIPSWSADIRSRFPQIDSILLNAGIQRMLDFTSPETISLKTCDDELTLNYISPLHMVTAFLPHLITLSPNPTSIVLMSSGLAVLPMPTVPNYCASKAALHSLAWSLRAQLAEGEYTKHIRVIEILPPAVHTKLHDGHPEHVHANLAKVAMDVDDFLEDTWGQLTQGENDEIPVGGVKTRIMSVETEKKNMFEIMRGMLKQQQGKS
jgi:short-subunit dehydrogenase involved in D-alanine esterification of teichoic acids